MNTTQQQQPKYQSGPMTFKRNASDAFAYYWVIAMYTLSVYEFVSFVRYGAYNATSSLIASLGIIGWCFSSKVGAQEQKNYTIEFGVNGTLGNGFSMRYKGHPLTHSHPSWSGILRYQQHWMTNDFPSRSGGFTR